MIDSSFPTSASSDCRLKLMAKKPRWLISHACRYSVNLSPFLCAPGDFLNTLAARASELPPSIVLQSGVFDGLISADDNVCGVRTLKDEQHARLVVGCNGRHSTVRENAPLREAILWLTAGRNLVERDKRDGDPLWDFGHKGSQQNFIMIDRGHFWQGGDAILKSAQSSPLPRVSKHYRPLPSVFGVIIGRGVRRERPRPA